MQITVTEEYDMHRCEFCPANIRIEDAVAVGECYLCPQCYREGVEALEKEGVARNDE